MIRRFFPSVVSAKKKRFLSLYGRLVSSLKTWRCVVLAALGVLVKMRVLLTTGGTGLNGDAFS